MDDIPIIKDYRLGEYFLELSADSLYPSAGSSAAMITAHAAALFAMACRVHLRKAGEKRNKKSKNKDSTVFWQEFIRKVDNYREQSLALAQEDGFAIKDYFEGNSQGAERLIDIPLEIARCAGEIITLTEQAFPSSYAPVQADIECARLLAGGGRKAALTIARYNLPLLDRSKQENYVNQIAGLEPET